VPPSSSSAAGGDVDAVVAGAGHNGLVAAAVLADAGWDVLVLEAQPDPGGAVRSAELIPGYISDLYSAFYPMTLVCYRSPRPRTSTKPTVARGDARLPSLCSHACSRAIQGASPSTPAAIGGTLSHHSDI
jgi:cation diffusion facilitator CzcD-associated flavoprotein CzcO